MPECCIGIGKCSYFYIYLLGAFSFNLIKKKILTINKMIINHHNLIRQVYKYIGFIIFGLLCNFILNKFLNKNDNNNKDLKRKQHKSQKLIYNDYLKLNKKDIIIFIIICLINVIYNESINIMSFYKFTSLMLWSIHIAIIIIFMKIYFPENIYKHQLYPMIFAIILSTILILISTFFNFENNNNIYQEKGVAICIFMILFYILIATFSSFSDTQIKILIDHKYKSPYTIITLIGIIGFFFTFIASICFFYFGDECNKEKRCDINCYGAISSYFDEFKNKYSDDKNNFYLEILIIPLYIIIEFLNILFYIFIIKYLNPTYLMLSDNIYFGINNIINYIDDYNSNEKDYTIKFLFNEISELLVFLAFCIYLEIVELRFCGLNRNIRKNIIYRGNNEADGDEDSILYLENNEEINNYEEDSNIEKIEIT